MSNKDIDIKKFAERVERLCDFLLTKTKRDGSDDVKIIEDLASDAANLQHPQTLNINGLNDYMNGVPNESSS